MNYFVIRTILISLGAASLLQLFLQQIQSNFIYDFLKTNITNIQIALLAVNAATLGIVLTKIREIIEKTGRRKEFESTRNEMLLSIKEQLSLVATSLLIVAICSAKNFPIDISQNVFETALIASFIYSMSILYDTAKSVFVILDY